MTRPETKWVLEQLGSVITDIDAPLRRIDRDEAILYDGDGTAPDLTESIRSRTAELRHSNLVAASFVDRSTSPAGTEYDHSVDAVVNVRLEGLHYTEFGHVDPDGAEGIAWDDLERRCRRAILAGRGYPDAGDEHTGYKDLLFSNEADNSDDSADFYQSTWDVVFSGFEELP